MPLMQLLAALILPLIIHAAHATTAVVFSESTGRWGVTWNESDKKEAIEVATERCRLLGGGKDCKPVKVTDERGFGAVANTCAGNYCGISVITGRRSAAQAERDAIKDCNSYYGTKNCYVLDNWEETGSSTPVAKLPPSKPIQQPRPVSTMAKSPDQLPAKPEQSKVINSNSSSQSCIKGEGNDHMAVKFFRDKSEGVKSILDDRNLIESKKCCDYGSYMGCLILDRFFMIDYHKNLQAAVSYFDEGCKYGYSRGCFSLGNLYYGGNGVPQDYQKAVQLFQTACDKDHSGACLNLAEIYNMRESGLFNLQKAISYYGKACNLQKKTISKTYYSFLYACNALDNLRGSK